MHYIYFLKSINFSEQRYIGYTTNLKQRLKTHNAGGSPHTARYKPWQLYCYIAFESREKALMFEKYLKAGSGRAFIQRHF